MSTEPEKLTPEERELLAGVPAEAWTVTLHRTFEECPHLCPWKEGYQEMAPLCGANVPQEMIRQRGDTWQLQARARSAYPGHYCPDCYAQLQAIARAALKALGGEVGDGG